MDAKPASSGRVYLLVARCHYYFMKKILALPLLQL